MRLFIVAIGALLASGCSMSTAPCRNIKDSVAIQYRSDSMRTADTGSIVRNYEHGYVYSTKRICQ